MDGFCVRCEDLKLLFSGRGGPYGDNLVIF